MKRTRRIEELNLLDDFLFYEVVSGEKGEKFCKLLIWAVCGRDVGKISVCPQKVIQGTDTRYRGVRMDLYVDEEGKCLYDIEPDKHTSKEVLPRRNRYYRALLDGKLLDTGENFEQLPEMWTIFILPYDPFGRNRMCYTVQNYVIEEPDVGYEDGAVSLFLYTKGKSDGNEELSQLLHYIENSVEDNAMTEELKELHQYVTAIKRKKEVGVRYMKSWELEWMWKKEGREEGREEARELGRQFILDLLANIGDVPDALNEKISCETNMEILARWHKLAAKVKSISEFENGMSEYENIMEKV